LAVLLSIFRRNVKTEDFLLKHKKFIGGKIPAIKFKARKNCKRTVKIE